MGNLSRQKGLSTEREIVNLHRKIGIAAERVPLSGANGYRDNGQDIDLYPAGVDSDFGPLCCQVKRNLKGTKGVIDALGDGDALFLRWDAEPGQPARAPLVVLPWATWERLLARRR